MQNIIAKADNNDKSTPTIEWLSFILYDSPKIPENMRKALRNIAEDKAK